MYGHVKFQKIGGLHNVVKTVDYLAEIEGEYPEAMDYRAKVKLHGANMAIRINPDGTLTPQSRNQDIDSGGYQFPSFINESDDYLRALARPDRQLVIFGEWAGPGIQRKVSVCKIDYKAFFIFALLERSEIGEIFTFEPDAIDSVLTKSAKLPDRFFVIPWFNKPIRLDFEDKPRLREQSEKFNEDVAAIDRCDPYIKETFAIEGPGEGLVYFPLTKTLPGDFGTFAFKVKGERHSQGSGGEKKARTQTPVAENVLVFVDMMVTPARVLQGATELFGDGPYEKKGLGPLIKWVLGDVQNEGRDELEVSDLDWKDVAKNIPQKVREHYFAEIEKI